MKLYFPMLALALISTTSFAKTYECEGTDQVRGKVEIKIANDVATATGSYTWEQNAGPDTNTHTVKCGPGKLNNKGRSGNKTHDYYDLKCEYYLRTRTDMTQYDRGYVSLVIPGPSDHDDSGYTYVNFFCR